MPRTKWAKKVPAGWSALTKHLLQDMFLRDKIATEGFQLVGQLVRVRFWALLADEEALQSIWYTTGASGLAPCGIMCSVTNKPVHTDVSRGIASLSDLDPAIPNISCGEESKCGLRTDKNVWGFCDALQLASSKDRAELERLSGIKYHPAALLYDKDLRPFVSPTKSTRFDPMHVLASNGLIGVEMMLCLTEMKTSVGSYFAEVRAFHSEEAWLPKCEVFSEARENSATFQVKGGASELWSAYPLLRRFVLVTYGEDAPELHVQSFLLLCSIADIFLLLMHGGGPLVAAPLPSLVSRYLAMFVLAHGLDAVRWKHHGLVHLYRQIMADDMSLNCWVTERKNIKGKQAVQNNQCTQQVEKTALSRMLNSQIRLLESPGWVSKLIQPARAFPELALTLSASKVELSSAMRWCGISIKSGNVLFLDTDRSRLVVVIGCFEVDSNTHGILVRAATSVNRAAYSSRWEVAADVSYYMFKKEDHVVQAAFYRHPAPDRVEVLH